MPIDPDLDPTNKLAQAKHQLVFALNVGNLDDTVNAIEKLIDIKVAKAISRLKYELS